jgi:hypothetical protein
VSGACGYEVQVARDPSFGADGAGSEPLTTAQAAIVPPKALITTPGVHYWRVRADYCAEVLGQWSATRSFRSVFPPDFNLNSVPSKVEFGRRVVIGGQLKNNGASVKKARLYLERRIFRTTLPRPTATNNSPFHPAEDEQLGRLSPGGAERNGPEARGRGIDVQPRMLPPGLGPGGAPQRPRQGTVCRSGRLRPPTSDGWQNLRKVAGRRNRFGGRDRPWTQHSCALRARTAALVNTASKRRGVHLHS